MVRLNKPLFEQITQFQIGWTLPYAQQCIDEYKKFIYLAMVSKHSVTPSDQVDQVWHLHLTYTQSYWIELCENILNTPLHHGPTQGGQAESTKYRSQYQATLDTYTRVFNEDPPQEIWPDCQQRFHKADKFVRINRADYVLLRKPSQGLLAIASLPIVLTACASDRLGSTTLLDAIIFLIFLFIGFVCFKLFTSSRGDGSYNRGSDSNWLSDWFYDIYDYYNDNDVGGCDSGCGGGCGGCGG